MTGSPDEGTNSERDEAVAALVKKHRQEIIEFARQRGADDPQDATDEAFFQLMVSWGQLHDTNKALAWVRTVVRRLICKQFRDRERERDLVRQLGLDPPTATQAEFDLILNEDQRAVFDAIRSLSPQQRVVIVLQFRYDLSIAEIARELSINDNTAKTHSRRAMAKLRKALGEHR